MSELETRSNAPSTVTILVLGIVGLALSTLGLPGLIISIICLKKAKEYEKCGLVLEGKALIGQRLAHAGKIVGIVMTIVITICIILAIIATIAIAFSVATSFPEFSSGFGSFDF